jgi:alpha-tubulin suppressor-like RCC1 family protein
MNYDSVPVLVSGGQRFAALSGTYAHTCGLTTGGAAYCWGSNGAGQLGTGATAGPQRCISGGVCSTAPVLVSGGLSFAALTAGGLLTCGLTTNGAAYCWGFNGQGQLGNGMTTGPQDCGGDFVCSATPVLVLGGMRFAALSAGFDHTCGRTTSLAAYCWGYGAFGKLGTGTTESDSVPVPVMGGLSFAALTASGDHTCGVTTGGAAYCWGYNYHGELGDGATTGPQCYASPTIACSSTPVLVSSGLNFAALSAGFDHTCGVTTDGVAYCWGSNHFGQLGNGTTTDSNAPVKVAGQR